MLKDNKQALETLKGLCLCGTCTTGDCTNCDRYNAKNRATEALEKQIPKEIDITIGGRLYGGCPVCGRLWQEPDHICNYCDCCGQKLKMPWQDN